MSDKTTVKVVVYKDDAHVTVSDNETVEPGIIPVSESSSNLLSVADDGLAATVRVGGGFGVYASGVGTHDDPVHIYASVSPDEGNLLLDPHKMPEVERNGGLLAVLETQNSDSVVLSGSGNANNPLRAELAEGAVPLINAAHMPSDGVETSAAPLAPNEVGVNKVPHLATVNLLEESEPGKWSAHLYVTREQSVDVSGYGVKSDPLVISLNNADNTKEKPNAIEVTDNGVIVDRYKLRDYEAKTVQFMIPETPKVITPKMGTEGNEHMREELLVLNGQNTDYTVDLTAITGDQEYTKHIRVVYYAVTLHGTDSSGVTSRGYSTLKFLTKGGRIITPYGKLVSASDYIITTREYLTGIFDIYFGDQNRVMLVCPVPQIADSQVFYEEVTLSDLRPSYTRLTVPLDQLPLYGLRCAYAVDVNVHFTLLTSINDRNADISGTSLSIGGRAIEGVPTNFCVEENNPTATLSYMYAAELSAKDGHGVLPSVELYVPALSAATSGVEEVKLVVRLKVVVRRINTRVSGITVMNETSDVTLSV
ncbi:hypothetical protein GJM53_RS19925 [Escherichia coli]|uniref:hypothetical protein n=1 Tax=Escherichia coli TaxID=562 RepID=UPI0017B59882|nr:hypothetical protein [Escherichia coli]EEQ8002696.1 hypothetical protein [Escherichia coli]EEQ8120684.1 hypothetical protein [Escherichia coli]EEX3715951.1 hypothetical protein [Escherichia coli]EEX9837966.1 hypothetical protein [Escherichia coli]EFB5887599.1 hypothetical protein [Escherichia coli]